MKTIKLSQGQVALVDDEDFERLNRHKWFALWYPGVKSFYAVRNAKKGAIGEHGKVYMAREVLGLKYGDKQQADHISHDTLNNTRPNLRICTHRENLRNQKRTKRYNGKKCSSEYKGVVWSKAAKKWVSCIVVSENSIYLGVFVLEIEAARAYDKRAKKLFGEFANLNFKE